MKAKLKIAFETLHGIADRKKYQNVFKELMPLFLSVYQNDIISMNNKEIAEEMKEMYEAYKIVTDNTRMQSLIDLRKDWEDVNLPDLLGDGNPPD